MDIPATMNGIVIREAGGPDVLVPAEVPVPETGAGQVLIKVAAAGVNRPDVYQRLGQYPPPAGASPLPGLEVSGTVVALGPEVTEWSVGEMVCALLPGGGYAEFAVADARSCLPIPDGLSCTEAAALPETTFTVWHNVFQRGCLQPGESVLVHGGASGIGTTAIQMIKAHGCEAIVTAGSDAKCKACLELGADLAINYHTEDFVSAIRDRSAKGVDVILDMVGGDYIAKNLKCLRPDGRLVFIAFLEGSKADVDFMTLMLKRLTITGSTLRTRPDSTKAEIAAAVRSKVWPWIEQGLFRPQIDQILPLSEASKAHRIMENSAHIGKIILEIE